MTTDDGSQQYEGIDVIDATGDKIGKADETYVDQNNQPKFVTVKTGMLFGKHHLVPLDEAELTDDGLQIPFSKDVVEESPTISSGQDLDPGLLSEIRSYYG